MNRSALPLARAGSLRSHPDGYAVGMTSKRLLKKQPWGRPKSDPELLAEEQRQFLDDQWQRNAVEGKIGQV